jgi:putative transposase
VPENAVLNGSMAETGFGFVEREATPQPSITLSIHPHPAALSLCNTVSIRELFGVDRVKSTVHNWVHEADLRPADGHPLDHVAVDETVMQLHDERYWLSAAVDPETNELLNTNLGPTGTNVLAHAFFAELYEKPDVDDVPRNRRFLVCGRDAMRLVDAAFLVDGETPLKDACTNHGLDLRDERHGNRDRVEHVYRDGKTQNYFFLDCSSSPRKLLKSGFGRSPSREVSYSSVCK